MCRRGRRAVNVVRILDSIPPSRRVEVGAALVGRFLIAENSIFTFQYRQMKSIFLRNFALNVVFVLSRSSMMYSRSSIFNSS